MSQPANRPATNGPGKNLIADQQNRFLMLLADGLTIDEIRSTMTFSTPTPSIIYEWYKSDVHNFRERYNQAMQSWAHAQFYRSVSIADDVNGDFDGGKYNPSAVTRSKLQIDTRIRLAERIAPELFDFKSKPKKQENSVNSDEIESRLLASKKAKERLRNV